MSMQSDTPNVDVVQRFADHDPELWRLVCVEQKRQEDTLEMIASENHTSPAVMAAVGSCLTTFQNSQQDSRRSNK